MESRGSCNHKWNMSKSIYFDVGIKLIEPIQLELSSFKFYFHEFVQIFVFYCMPTILACYYNVWLSI